MIIRKIGTAIKQATRWLWSLPYGLRGSEAGTIDAIGPRSRLETNLSEPGMLDFSTGAGDSMLSKLLSGVNGSVMAEENSCLAPHRRQNL
jgi:hypothetical protein